MRVPKEKQNRTSRSTAWKIRIDNDDLNFLKRVSEAIARKDRGLIPEPSITALIQTAIKNYISEAFQCYDVGAVNSQADRAT